MKNVITSGPAHKNFTLYGLYLKVSGTRLVSGEIALPFSFLSPLPGGQEVNS